MGREEPPHSSGSSEEGPPRRRRRRTARPAAAQPAQPAQLAGEEVPLQLQPGGWTDLGGGARVGYWPRRIAAPGRLLDALLREVAWEQRSVVLFGRSMQQRRLVAYMSDPGLAYSYSGLTLQPAPWSPAVAAVKAVAEELGGRGFNSCLLNRYRDGGDALGWHADDEPLYGPEPVIASVSLGAPRDFVLRRKPASLDRGGAGPQQQQQQRKVCVQLGGGDVLVMAGTTQRDWQHCVPARRRAVGERVNLTFRAVVGEAAQAQARGRGRRGA